MNIRMDLEQHIGDLKVPEIDIHDQVMHKLSTNKQKGFTLNTKVLIASIVSLLVIIGTGFASVHFIILYNDKGDELLSIQPLVESNSNKISESYMNLIEYGEALALYSPDENGFWSVSTIIKPVLYDDWGIFYKAIDHAIPISPSFQDDYIFKHGRITYEALSSDNESLIKESLANGNSVTYKKLELSESIGLISLTVEKANDEYTISITNAEKFNTIYIDQLNDLKNITKFKLNGTEGFVSKVDNQAYAMWRSSKELGGKLYEVNSTNTTSSVDEEIKALLLSLSENENVNN